MNKKIIFLIPTLSMGGGERVVSELSLALPDSIKRTIVLFKKEIFYPYKGKLISLNLQLSNGLFFKIYYFIKGIYKFLKIVRKEKPDYIFTFGFPADLMGLLASSEKTLIGVHSLWSKSHGNIIEKTLIKAFFNKSKMVICVSKTAAQDLIENFNIKKEKINVIYNPIDVEKIKKLANLPLEQEYQEIFKGPIIISMGRLSEEKNQSALIKAFKEVKNKISKANLVILGDGEKKASLKQLAKELGIAGSVHFLGTKENPFKFLAKAKLFILSSLREGLPCSILEAMACGLPIISTDCRSGPREILAPKTNTEQKAEDNEYAEFGILTPISGQKIAEAAINVLTNEVLQNNLVKKSLQRAEDFDIKNIIKQWEFLNK